MMVNAFNKSTVYRGVQGGLWIQEPLRISWSLNLWRRTCYLGQHIRPIRTLHKWDIRNKFSGCRRILPVFKKYSLGGILNIICFVNVFFLIFFSFSSPNKNQRPSTQWTLEIFEEISLTVVWTICQSGPIKFLFLTVLKSITTTSRCANLRGMSDSYF